MKNFDILVIGGGPGGYVAAIKAAQLGAQVALIEDHKLGGICLNYGCIPTKSYLKSSKVFDFLKNSHHYGINKPEEITFDWSSILSRKNKIVDKLLNGIHFLLKKNKISFFNGFAEALSSTQVKVGNNILTTKKLIIATGASAFIPPISGAQESYQKGFLLTSKELVNLKTFPKKIVIIGGGVIGVEFATIFISFGAEVIILERQDNILASIDQDIISAYTKKLQKDGVKILTQAEVTSIKDNKVFYNYQKEQQSLTSDIILMAVGSKPNFKGLEKLNLKKDHLGIVTDEFLRTSQDSVYAIGDVNGKAMLAHVASHEGIIAVNHALQKEKNQKGIDYNLAPWCIYGSPEIAYIGLTEKQIKEQKIEYKISKFPLSSIGKALADGETEGFAKMIVDKNTLEILGMHIYAYNATELISEIGVAMELKGTADKLIHAIHPHPTLAELTFETLLGAVDKPIHM